MNKEYFYDCKARSYTKYNYDNNTNNKDKENKNHEMASKTNVLKHNKSKAFRNTE